MLVISALSTILVREPSAVLAAVCSRALLLNSFSLRFLCFSRLRSEWDLLPIFSMAQAYRGRAPFTDSNYPLPHSVVASMDNRSVEDGRTSSLALSKGEQEPLRKADIFKRITKQSSTITPSSQDGVAESSVTESHATSSIPPAEIVEPPMPSSASIFKKLVPPSVTSICAPKDNEAAKALPQPTALAPVVHRKPLLSPSQETRTHYYITIHLIRHYPVGIYSKYNKSVTIQLLNSPPRKFHNPVLAQQTSQGEHEQTTNLQVTEALQDIAEDLLVSPIQRTEHLEDDTSVQRNRVASQHFEDNLSDII
ncbi:hypothetical protein QR46_0230 [Giardia duodenalis assemblage B]|uniref:Uncharacterized protein n=1 Tax=Giardia duodenalis assemblage B TaxID=1394984 RepID=A0A132P0E2_GIAIN|nr:hypothetical protein QR46_0230 [Giardia intestinalis assemblage B]